MSGRRGECALGGPRPGAETRVSRDAEQGQDEPEDCDEPGGPALELEDASARCGLDFAPGAERRDFPGATSGPPRAWRSSPILLGWIAAIDEDKAKVGTMLPFLVPYASYLLVCRIVMLAAWCPLGLPVGQDSPIFVG